MEKIKAKIINHKAKIDEILNRSDEELVTTHESLSKVLSQKNRYAMKLKLPSTYPSIKTKDTLKPRIEGMIFWFKKLSSVIKIINIELIQNSLSFDTSKADEDANNRIVNKCVKPKFGWYCHRWLHPNKKSIECVKCGLLRPLKR